MARFELTKSIEARKLNKRTMNPLGPERFPVPFGAILDNVKEERGLYKFFYLTEPYEVPVSEVETALKPVD